MEITQKRKIEMVEEVLNHVRENYNVDGLLERGLFINKEKTSFNPEEMDFLKSKLANFAKVEEDENVVYIKNINELLAQAHHKNPEMDKIMTESVQKNGSFLSKHPKFASIGAVAIPIAAVIVAGGVLATGAGSPIVVTSSLVSGLTTFGRIANDVLQASDKAKVRTTFIEFAALLNKEFGINKKEKTFEVKNNSEGVLDKLRNMVQDNYSDKKLSV